MIQEFGTTNVTVELSLDEKTTGLILTGEDGREFALMYEGLDGEHYPLSIYDIGAEEPQ